MARVSVPATSANLGPGFDSLGLALSLRDELEGELAGSGLVIEVTGEGAGNVPLDEDHLVVRSIRAFFDGFGVSQPPGLRLTCHNSIPHARGLGSSAAAVVGGLVLARALSGRDYVNDGDLLELAVELEGHPDNVAPALRGGFVISGRDERGEVFGFSAPVDERVTAEVFVPPEPLSTQVARGLLPSTVPHGDAAANAGAAALLVAGMASGAPESLWAGTRDFLHQEYRRPAMPASLDLVHRLRAEDWAAVVSGAGPSVLVLVGGGEDLSAFCPQGWTHHLLAVDTRGALVG